MLRRCLNKSYRLQNVTFQRGLFRKESKLDDKDTNNQTVKETNNQTDKKVDRQYRLDNSTIFSTKYNMNLLKHKGKLSNKKPYNPPGEIEGIVQEVMERVVGGKTGEGWHVPFESYELKFKVLSTLMTHLAKDIPSHLLDTLKCPRDALDFFKIQVTLRSSYDELAAGNIRELPKNLHIQKEALRFNSRDDTLFGGRTAFPGSNTVVTSIKYQRKYEDCITSKEKPGFNDYYYGF